MKKNKFFGKAAAALLAAVVTVGTVLTGAVPAMAAELTITIKANGQGNVGGAERFTAYQIFTGTVGPDAHQLGNLTWGSDIDDAKLLAALKDTSTIDGNTFGAAFTAAWGTWNTSERDEMSEAEMVAQFLEAHKDDVGYADTFARAAAASLKTEGTEGTKSTQPGGSQVDSNWEITVPAAGYYLVVDNYTGDSATPGATSSYILEVIGELEVDLKATLPTVEKKVNGQDGFLAGTDEEITFTLTGTVANNIAEYDTYYYQFVDTVTKGLTLNAVDASNPTVTVGGKTLTYEDDYTAVIGEAADFASSGAHTLTVTIDDLKAKLDAQSVDYSTPEAAAAIQVVVTYKAKLNKDAVVGSTGNPNNVTLEYSNNPYGEEHGKTTPDEVKTYTLDLDIVKTGEDAATKLDGVKFKLKNNADQYAVMDTSVTDQYSILSWDPSETSGTEMTTNTEGKFTIHGLDVGTYTLVETATKEGYEKLKDLKFQITDDAGNTVDSADGSLKTGLSWKLDDADATRDDAAFTGSFSTGDGTLTVKNFASPILPNTGGIGAGIVLAISAVVAVIGCIALFFAFRKKNA